MSDSERTTGAGSNELAGTIDRPGAGWELAIFDCDGVLVDTEVLTHRVLIDALSGLGIDLDLGRALTLFMGNTLRQNVEIIESLLGGPLPAGFFEQWREQLYARFRSEPVRAVAGVEAVLDGLAMPVCVVSNGPFRKMRTSLGVSGLLDRFRERLYSSESGLPGKPAPDLFLAAARDFGARPERTFVVEDSPKGVAGAVAAGMTVFGYAGADYVDAADLEAAGAIPFSQMSELPGLIERGVPRIAGTAAGPSRAI